MNQKLYIVSFGYSNFTFRQDKTQHYMLQPEIRKHLFLQQQLSLNNPPLTFKHFHSTWKLPFSPLDCLQRKGKNWLPNGKVKSSHLQNSKTLFTQQQGAFQFEFYQHLMISHGLHWTFSTVIILDPTVSIIGQLPQIKSWDSYRL